MRRLRAEQCVKTLSKSTVFLIFVTKDQPPFFQSSVRTHHRVILVSLQNICCVVHKVTCHACFLSQNVNFHWCLWCFFCIVLKLSALMTSGDVPSAVLYLQPQSTHSVLFGTIIQHFYYCLLLVECIAALYGDYRCAVADVVVGRARAAYKTTVGYDRSPVIAQRYRQRSAPVWNVTGGGSRWLFHT